MGLPDLYPAQVGSPYTILAASYTTGEATMTVVDATKLPDAPNIVCLAGAVAGEFRYTGKDGNTLLGVVKLPGTPNTTWPAGTFAFRGIAAYDLNSLIRRAEALEGYLCNDGEKIHISDEIPTPDVGEVGDLWFVSTTPPNEILDLAIWLDADDIYLKDGDPVDVWPDKSGNAKHAVQETPAARPVFRKALANGHSTVDFSTGEHYLTAPHTDTDGDSSRTMFVALALYKPAHTGEYMTFLSAYPDFCAGYLAVMTTNKLQGGFTDTAIAPCGSEPLRLNTSGVFPLNQTCIVAMRIEDEVNGTLYLNGVQAAQKSIGGKCTLGSFKGYRVGTREGAGTPGSRWWQGQIHEVIIYDRALSAAEVKQVNTYLMAKYGVIPA